MSSMTKRVDRITKKTHIYISAADLRLARDCFKCMLEDENLELAEYENELKRLNELWRDYAGSKDKAKLEVWREAMEKSTPAAYNAFSYDHRASLCENCPNGLWMEKEIGEKWMIIIANARSYFKWKKE